MPFSLAFPEPGTCEPAVGGSTVVAFFGQPASNAAAAHRQAIDSIFFIEFSTLSLDMPKLAL